MREIRTSGSMSGDGKRSHRYDDSLLSMPTAPILDSTIRAITRDDAASVVRMWAEFAAYLRQLGRTSE
jgi:hypothetical protein